MAKGFSATVVLVRGYTSFGLSLLTEPWRVANSVAGSDLAKWQLTTWKGDALPDASGGSPGAIGATKEAGEGPDLAVVVGGDSLTRAPEKPLLTWLKRAEAAGTMVAGVGAGNDVLARAGLLEAGGGSVPMEAAESFRQQNINPALAHGLYSIIGKRAACAGGSATLDFSLALVSYFMGPDMAQKTEDALTYQRRHSEVESLISHSDMRRADRRLAVALRWLSSLLSGDEASVKAAAAASELSERQLLRLFHDTFEMAPRRYQEALRLYRARTLLRETDLTIITTALAVGFAGGPELSRAFQRQFDESPTDYRKRMREPDTDR